MADLAIAGFDTAADTRCRTADGYPREPNGPESTDASVWRQLETDT
jgi:hypothetical protein